MKFVIALCLFGLTYAANPVCRLAPETGPCRAYMPMYYYDSETRECQKFVYGGCNGNGNRFFTEDECRQTCATEESNVAICHLEPEKGHCLAYMPRYYYNAKERRCDRFIYGGCQGNPNNFETQEECEAICAPLSETEPVCELDAEPGRCLAYMPRYYYNKKSGECEKFIYGGCGGNANNFKTKEECEEQCAVSETEPVCELEAEKGPCRAYMPRYHYNKESGECESFIYGGCRGNANNFKTKKECEEQCAVSETEPVCELKAERGPCLAYMPRYLTPTTSRPRKNAKNNVL